MQPLYRSRGLARGLFGVIAPLGTGRNPSGSLLSPAGTASPFPVFPASPRLLCPGGGSHGCPPACPAPGGSLMLILPGSCRSPWCRSLLVVSLAGPRAPGATATSSTGSDPSSPEQGPLVCETQARPHVHTAHPKRHLLACVQPIGPAQLRPTTEAGYLFTTPPPPAPAGVLLLQLGLRLPGIHLISRLFPPYAVYS